MSRLLIVLVLQKLENFSSVPLFSSANLPTVLKYPIGTHGNYWKMHEKKER